MITLTSVSNESISSMPLGSATLPEDRRARWTMTMRRRNPSGTARRTETTDDDRAAASTVKPRPTEEYDESQSARPRPARDHKGN